MVPQQGPDGIRRDLVIRFDDVAALPDGARERIFLRHAAVIAGLGEVGDDVAIRRAEAYRLHQWENHPEGGVRGYSLALGGTHSETHDDGRRWTLHSAGKVANWDRFLPGLYHMHAQLCDSARHPAVELSVTGQGLRARYLCVP